jgi:exodeoxyribonuclease-3
MLKIARRATSRLIQPESRQAFARLLAQGWTDALRKLYPSGPLWTFWDYKRERWAADKGMRLDHFLLSPALSERLIDGGVDRGVRGEENASDHAPAQQVERADVSAVAGFQGLARLRRKVADGLKRQ